MKSRERLPEISNLNNHKSNHQSIRADPVPQNIFDTKPVDIYQVTEFLDEITEHM